MASPVPGYISPGYAPARPHPKLSYRTRSDDAASITTHSTAYSAVTASPTSTVPTSPMLSDFCPSPRLPPSPLSTRPPSVAASPLSPRAPVKPLKKTSSFFSSLFSAKEPSAQALADYQKQLLKQGRTHNRRINAVGMPGVSSAKLPPTVPKVNSKWDGIPQTVKGKEEQQWPSRHSMGGLSRGVGSVRSGRSDERSISASALRRSKSPGTTGGVSGNNQADLYGWELGSPSATSSSKDLTVNHGRPTTAHTTSTHSARSTLDPTSYVPTDTPHPPEIPSTFLQSSPLAASSTLLPPGHSYSPSTTPLDSSPVTPEAPSPLISITSPQSLKNPQETLLPQSVKSPRRTIGPSDTIRTTTIQAPASVDKVILKSSGVNILGPPASAKKKNKPAAFSPIDERPQTSATDSTHGPMIENDTPALSSSLATTSASTRPEIFQRHNPRLGLGMCVTNQDVPPWDSPAQALGNDTELERIVTPTPEGGQSLMRKGRLGMFGRG